MPTVRGAGGSKWAGREGGREGVVMIRDLVNSMHFALLFNLHCSAWGMRPPPMSRACVLPASQVYLCLLSLLGMLSRGGNAISVPAATLRSQCRSQKYRQILSSDGSTSVSKMLPRKMHVLERQ